MLTEVSAWSTYRKTEPLRWTPYLDDCLRLIGEGKETYLDVYLAAQIKCQIITNHLTCPCAYELTGPDSLKVSSAVLTSALLRQLNDIQKSLPPQVRSDSEKFPPRRRDTSRSNIYQGRYSSTCTTRSSRSVNLTLVDRELWTA